MISSEVSLGKLEPGGSSGDAVEGPTALGMTGGCSGPDLLRRLSVVSSGQQTLLAGVTVCITTAGHWDGWGAEGSPASPEHFSVSVIMRPQVLLRSPCVARFCCCSAPIPGKSDTPGQTPAACGRPACCALHGLPVLSTPGTAGRHGACCSHGGARPTAWQRGGHTAPGSG